MTCPACSHPVDRHGEFGCEDSIETKAWHGIAWPCLCPLNQQGKRAWPEIPKPPLGERRVME